LSEKILFTFFLFLFYFLHHFIELVSICLISFSLLNQKKKIAQSSLDGSVDRSILFLANYRNNIHNLKLL